MRSYKGYTNFEINLKGGKYSTLMEKSIFVTTCRFGIIFFRFYVFFSLSPPSWTDCFFIRLSDCILGLPFSLQMAKCFLPSQTALAFGERP